MPWKDRLRTLAYTPPDESEIFEPYFDGLSRSGGKKAPVTEFPGQDEASVQDLGNEITSLPIRCYFSGPEYDKVADRFWISLSQYGYGTLSHPRWGNFIVLPSTRQQTEEFVDGVGRAVFRVDFIRISDTAQEYPRSRAAADDQVTADVDAVAESQASEFDGTELTEPREQAALKDQVLGTMDEMSESFRDAAAQVDGLTQQIESQIQEIESAIDNLVTAPADLFDSLLSLYRLPARTAARVEDKLDGYRSLYEGLAQGFADTTQRYGELFGLVASSQVSAATAAAAESTVEGSLPTRGSASRAVDKLTQLDSDATALMTDLEGNGGFVAPYSVQADVSRVVSRAAGSLVDRALSLPTERVKLLDQDYTPASLTWELWGDVDKLDLLINYNDLSGDELFLIPAGREVRWYV